ncbi:MAG: radical SAM protein [Sandaracinaceae bacterium]|nr:radical SAM protein [Sandaracinaceae bacterium]
MDAQHHSCSTELRGPRSVPLDGARLLFDPRTGLNLRVEGPSTRGLVRTAPRVVLFGITNQCNLRCSFCSRDSSAPSEWTPDSAFEMLTGLAERGVLEVAFGGGEPLAFRGFDALVERLATETSLAVHITTNGVLLTTERLARIAPHLGEVRLSIYDDTPWPERVAALADAPVQFGVNLLVTPDRVPALGPTLHRLEELGCRDVALLRYVGPDATQQLSRSDEQRVEAAIRATGMSARLSVCFGEHLGALPRLFDGDGPSSDCGAGGEFLVLTSERTVKQCSFAFGGTRVETADDVLRVYRDERARLQAPVAKLGCARAHGMHDGGPHPQAPQAEADVDTLRVWQGFSGNNSGDCVLVGRFERANDARAFVASLESGFVPGNAYGEAWKALLAAAGLTTEAGESAPEVLVAVGRSVLARTWMAVDDDFPSLRALLWKQGGRAVVSAVHEHDPVVLVAGLGFTDAASLEAAEVALAIDDVGHFARRGLSLLGTLAPHGPEDFTTQVETLERVAAAQRGVLAAELAVIPEASRVPLARAFSARPAAGPEYMLLRFYDAEHAAEFAAAADTRVAAAGRTVLAPVEGNGRHQALRASARGGVATVFPGPLVTFETTFYYPERERTVAAERLTQELRAELGSDGVASLRAHWRSAVGTVTTSEPFTVLPFLQAFADARQLVLWVDAHVERPLVEALARIDVDLASLLRERTR